MLCLYAIYELLRYHEPIINATIPVILTLGAKPYDYDVFMFGIGFRYTIGGAEASADSSAD